MFVFNPRDRKVYVPTTGKFSIGTSEEYHIALVNIQDSPARFYFGLDEGAKTRSLTPDEAEDSLGKLLYDRASGLRAITGPHAGTPMGEIAIEVVVTEPIDDGDIEVYFKDNIVVTDARTGRFVFILQ